MSTALRLDGASGTGLATFAADGTVLDTWYPAPALGPDAADTPPELGPLVGADAARGVTTAIVRTHRRRRSPTRPPTPTTPTCGCTCSRTG